MWMPRRFSLAPRSGRPAVSGPNGMLREGETAKRHDPRSGMEWEDGVAGLRHCGMNE